MILSNNLKENTAKAITIIDISKIKELSPLDVLKWIISHRKEAQLADFIPASRKLLPYMDNNSETKKFSQLMNLVINTELKHIFFPVNPLILSMAICISIVKGRDFLNYLQSYVDGKRILNSDAKFINLEAIKNEEELNEILELNEEYVAAFESIGTELYIDNKPLIENGLLVTLIPTVFHVYWGAWLAANPEFQLKARWVELGWAVGLYYSRCFNDLIHNSMEKYSFELNKTNKDINMLMANKMPQKDKKKALNELCLKQKNLTLLNRYTQRLYHWMPEEIAAHNTGIQSGYELIQKGEIFIDAIRAYIIEGYEKFLLPDEVIVKLNSKKENKNE